MEAHSMRVAATLFNIETKVFEIYYRGCNAPHCPGCHNPELQSFKGKAFDFDPAVLCKRDVNYFYILGGEPLDQGPDLLWHLELLAEAVPQAEIVLFTKKTEIPQEVIDRCDFIKCGPYMHDLPPKEDPMLGLTLASSNQYVRAGGRNVYPK